MSTKDWKNGELTQLLSEAWGFKFDTGLLNEEAAQTHFAGDPMTKKEKQQDDELEEDKDYTAKREKPGEDKRKGAEKRGAEGTLAKTKGHGRVDYVNEDEDYTAKREKPGEDKRKGAEKRGAEGTLAKTKGHGRVDYVNEDSGARETWDQWKNEHADDDHIREIEHHLRALKDDRDYERHEAEYDHDKYEDEGEPMEEMESRATNREMAGKGSDERLKPSLGEAQIRKLVRKRLQAMMENKKGGSNK